LLLSDVLKLWTSFDRYLYYCDIVDGWQEGHVACKQLNDEMVCWWRWRS